MLSLCAQSRGSQRPRSATRLLSQMRESQLPRYLAAMELAGFAECAASGELARPRMAQRS